MENRESFDFYTMGMRHASDLQKEVKGLAEKIEKEYGIDARLEFEVGLKLSTVSTFSNDIKETFDKRKVPISSQIDTMPNSRNNSYFGGSGISNQYNETGSFREPNVAKKK